MRESLTQRLLCPTCADDVHVAAVESSFVLAGETHVVTGLLECANRHRFPVIDEVPRMVPDHLLSDAELEARRKTPARRQKNVTPEVISPDDAADAIRTAIARQYDLRPDSSPASRSRARHHADYLVAEYHGVNKAKYGRLLKRLVGSAASLLDVGGSLPGLTTCIASELAAGHAVVADLAIQHARLFKSPDRRISLVRADAQRLPFKRSSFELVCSAFLLEHVPDWALALKSMNEVGQKVFIAYGPNRWFPFEIGHVNAPLAGTLNRRTGKYVAYVWLKAIGQQRTLAWLDEYLAGMSYISSKRFQRECRRLGLRTQNVFAPMMEELLRESGTTTSGLRRLVRAWPSGTRAAARMLAATGFEPQVYFFLTKARPEALSATVAPVESAA